MDVIPVITLMIENETPKFYRTRVSPSWCDHFNNHVTCTKLKSRLGEGQSP